MALSYHLIVPLPNGRTGSTGHLSVFFVPRLQEFGNLADWTQDWRNWPKVINGTAPGAAPPLQLSVGLAASGGNFTVAAVNRDLAIGDAEWVSAAPSEEAWDAMFATDTLASIRVDRFRPVVRIDDDLLAPMFDAQLVTSDVPEMHKNLAIDFPTAPPTVDQLAQVQGYQSFLDSGVVEEYEAHLEELGDGTGAAADNPEEADFHGALTFVQAHPELLRSLGLVVDLDVTLSATRTRVTVGSDYMASYPGDAVSMEVAFDSDFWPEANSALATGATSRGGSWPTIGDGSHSIGCVDIGPAVTDTSEIAEGLEPDRPAAVSPMREDGVYLVRDGGDLTDEIEAQWAAQAAFEQQVKAYLLANDPDPIPVDGEALSAGRRYDVYDTLPSQWFSLWDRIVSGGFDFPRAPSLTIVPPGDEGWMTFTAMTEAPSELDDPAGNTDPPQTGEGLVVAPPKISRTPIRVSPKIFGWNGWSNVANPPGAAFCGVTGAADVVPGEATDDMDVKVGVDYSVPNGVLPRLRYTREYKFRARGVDLAGNSRDLFETHPGGNTETELITYGRTAPMGAPVPVRRESKPIPGVGDTPTTCVIKSEFGQADATVTPTSRVIFPSQTGQFQCELHGYPGPDGLFTDQATFDMVVARTAASIVDDTDEDPTSGELMSPGQQWGPPTTYLGEPAFDGYALLNLPGTVGATTVSTADFWPVSHAMGVEVRAGNAAPVTSTPATDAPSIIVEVPKGITREISATQRPSLALLDHWKIYQDLSPAEQNGLRPTIRSGAHWMFSSGQAMKLIHAVRRPLSIPSTEVLGIVRSLNSSNARLTGRLLMDVKSTGTVDIAGSWVDPVDSLASSTGTAEVQTARFFFTQTEDYSEVGFRQFATTTFDLGDTKRHDVDLTLDAFSRYARHFTERTKITFESATDSIVLHPDGVSDLNIRVIPESGTATEGRLNIDFTIDHTAGSITRTQTSSLPIGDAVLVEFIGLPINRRSDEERAKIQLIVPNSGVPAVPGLVEALPAFSRQRLVQGDTVGVVHEGQTIRVWLRRPWFTTGEGELLGVVLGDGEAGPLTQAARDPLSTTGPAAPLTVDDFPAATTTRTGIGGLDVAGHEVTFDNDRKQWYADVVISADLGYRPFVKLALVRLQPVSITGAFIGASVTTEPVRLGADRQVRITRNGADIDISVTGRELGNTMTAQLQFSDPDIADADLSWKDLDGSVALTASVGADETTWTASVTAPESDNPVRVVIEDAEQLDGGPSVVYIDTVPVPAEWVGGGSGPLAIGDLTAQGGHEAALAKWSEPVGAKVTAYRLERSDGGGPWGNAVDLTPNRTKYIARRLTNGVTYSFRVRATDASGDGPWSEPADTVPEITPPGRVRKVTAVSGGGSVELEWKAVATRGAVLTSYVVEQRTSSGDWGSPVTVAGSATTATIGGFASGATVGFRVRAENAAGAGDWSTATSVTVVGGGSKPEAVHGVNVSAVSGGVSATWQPADDGGSALNGYQAQIRPLGGAWGSTQNIKAEVLVAEFVGLSSKDVYEVRVRAGNIVGVGDWSVAGVGSAGA